MKPCLVCEQPKGYHSSDFILGTRLDHEYKADNLAYLERMVKLKETREKARKLNWCLICKNVRKSPFGICKECSAKLILEKQNEKIAPSMSH
jgi:hypothetical protein